MTIDTTPTDNDYDSLCSAVRQLTEKAVKDGADPQFVASSILAESMGTAFSNGLTCALKHILHTDQMAELQLKEFYDTYNHRFHLREALKGNLVEKK